MQKTVDKIKFTHQSVEANQTSQNDRSLIDPLKTKHNNEWGGKIMLFGREDLTNFVKVALEAL